MLGACKVFQVQRTSRSLRVALPTDNAKDFSGFEKKDLIYV